MNDITKKSLTDQIEALRTKKISSVELTNKYLENIEANKDLNAYITVTPEKAIESAKHFDNNFEKIVSDADSKNRLAGVPISLKDLILTKGIRSTAASKMLENFIPPYNATVTEKVINEGAVILGKVNLDEFAMGSSNENSYFGPVLNPHKKDRVPGGTSGGSAAAVAAHLCAASVGTDTGGSVRQPASFCGVVGLKPTYGRVSRYGVIAYASSLDQVGPVTKTVKDAALMLEVLAGKDPHDATSSKLEVPAFSKNLNPNIKGLRVGIPKEYFIEGVNKEVLESVKNAIKDLESLGAIPVEISLPNTESAVSAYYIIAPAEASSNLARYDGIRYGHRSKENLPLVELYNKSRSEGFGSEVKRRIVIGSFVLSSGYHDDYYLKAQKVRTLIYQDFANAFKDKCDIIACPTAPTTAFKLGSKTSNPVEMYLEDIFTIPVNLAGLTAISVPCGMDLEGLPIGLQLIGNHWQEQTILNVAHAYETNMERRAPARLAGVAT